MKILIAEIGNNHFGSFDKAKEMIRVAKNSGATLVKGQAFLARDIKNGSMPYDFYRHVEFNFEQYAELIYFARDLGIELFYSIFSRMHEPICYHQRFHKIAGFQTRECGNAIDKKDSPNVFVSIPELVRTPWLSRAQVLYVSEYLTKDPKIDLITYFSDFYRRQVGYSDHTVGISSVIKAIKEHNAQVIEKHFYLGDKIVWKGQTYRDTIHAATPKEFEQLAKELGL